MADEKHFYYRNHFTFDELFEYDNDVTDQYDIGVIRNMVNTEASYISISEKNEHELFVTYTICRSVGRMGKNSLPMLLNRTAIVSKKVYNVAMRDKKIKRLLNDE